MLEKVIEIAREAGEVILPIYETALEIEIKADNSPLTRADRESHNLITQALSKHTPDIPVVSEEDLSRVEIRSGEPFWIVDPLDGTKEFIKKTGQFTVNIALIENGYPVLGVVYVPAQHLTYYAQESLGAFRRQNDEEPIRIKTQMSDGNLRVIASRDHAGPLVKEMLARMNNATCLSMGSSLKFCLVAEGAADLYLRDQPTMEWDTAAAQCVVECAGGSVTELDGRRLGYNKPAFRNAAIITVGDRSLNWQSYLN